MMCLENTHKTRTSLKNMEKKLTNKDVNTTSKDEQEHKTLEELNQELSEVQKEFKEARDKQDDNEDDNSSQEEEIANKQRAIEKTKQKIQNLKNQETKQINEGEKGEKNDSGYNFNADDTYDMRSAGIRSNSEKAKIIKQFIDAGIVDDVQQALQDPAVLAKLNQIDVVNNARAVADENDNDDYIANTKKDIEAKYSASGEVPKGKDEIEILAKSNLDKMGL